MTLGVHPAVAAPGLSQVQLDLPSSSVTRMIHEDSHQSAGLAACGSLQVISARSHALRDLGPGETPPAGATPEIEGRAVILEHERPVPTPWCKSS